MVNKKLAQAKRDKIRYSESVVERLVGFFNVMKFSFIELGKLSATSIQEICFVISLIGSGEDILSGIVYFFLCALSKKKSII